MQIKPIPPQNVTFGYHHPLKTEWIKGKLPSVKKGFYGDTLTRKNVSLEHLKPYSQGGRSQLDNFVLSTKLNNQKRGVKDLQDVATKENILTYLLQFVGVKTGNFNGDDYIHKIIKTLDKLGIKLS